MYGNLVIQGNNTQVPIFKFRNPSPKPIPILFLGFNFFGIFDYIYTPFFS